MGQDLKERVESFLTSNAKRLENMTTYKCRRCKENKANYEGCLCDDCKTEISEGHSREIHFRDIPYIYRESKLEDFTGIEQITEWAANPAGQLFIHGPCGVGKSHLVCAMILEMRNNLRRRINLFAATKISISLRNSFKNDLEDEVLSTFTGEHSSDYRPDMFSDVKQKHIVCPINFFDDIGTTKLTEYSAEVWYHIINTRYSEMMPTVYTSNFTLKEISVSMGDRIASRLASGLVFELKGADRRLKKN